GTHDSIIDSHSVRNRHDARGQQRDQFFFSRTFREDLGLRDSQRSSCLHDMSTGHDAIADGWGDEVDLELRRQYAGVERSKSQRGVTSSRVRDGTHRACMSESMLLGDRSGWPDRDFYATGRDL